MVRAYTLSTSVPSTSRTTVSMITGSLPMGSTTLTRECARRNTPRENRASIPRVPRSGACEPASRYAGAVAASRIGPRGQLRQLQRKPLAVRRRAHRTPAGARRPPAAGRAPGAVSLHVRSSSRGPTHAARSRSTPAPPGCAARCRARRRRARLDRRVERRWAGLGPVQHLCEASRCRAGATSRVARNRADLVPDPGTAGRSPRSKPGSTSWISRSPPARRGEPVERPCRRRGRRERSRTSTTDVADSADPGPPRGAPPRARWAARYAVTATWRRTTSVARPARPEPRRGWAAGGRRGPADHGAPPPPASMACDGESGSDGVHAHSGFVAAGCRRTGRPGRRIGRYPTSRRRPRCATW